MHKPALKAGKLPIIRRNLGSKLIKMEFAPAEEKASQPASWCDRGHAPEQRNRYSLTDADVTELARTR